MKTRAVISALCLLSLTACLGNGPGEDTVKRAMQGETKAMFHLADYHCAREPVDSNGAETLKWWKKIAQGRNKHAAAQAEEYLGLFHLSLFANEDTYNPDAPEEISYCTGSPGKPAYAKAIRHFTRCAESGFDLAQSCQADLGHLYLHRKDYARAYFWYATVLAKMADEIYGPEHAQEITPLDPELSTTLPAQNARRAAEHLTTENAAAIAKRAQEWVKEREKKAAPRG